jgi:hypothetical protein
MTGQNIQPTQPEPQTNLNPQPQPQPLKKEGECCGRTASEGGCSKKEVLFTIATIVGAILLLIGLLALAGYLAPNAGGGTVGTLLRQLNEVATFVAAKAGSELFTLTVFSLAFGAGFTLTGSVGLCIDRCEQREEALKQAPAQ